jgi:multiple sugar transport system substrate-binding protein
MRGKDWIRLPIGANSEAIVYRQSHVKAAGFDTLTTTDGYQTGPGNESEGTPVGHALGHAGRCHNGATGSCGHTAANWSTNQAMGDRSSETIAALEYCRQLYERPSGTPHGLTRTTTRPSAADQRYQQRY